MEIAIISEDFIPYTASSPKGAYIASLAGEFVRLGHNVSLFLPMPEGLDVGAHSLARRLVSLAVTSRDNSYDCIRYDGRTSSGVQAYLVEIEGLVFDRKSRSGDSKLHEIFALGVAEILKTLDLEPDWSLTLDASLAMIPNIAKNDPYRLSTKHMHLNLQSEAETPALDNTLEQADALVATNIQPNSDAKMGSNRTLNKLIADGRATVLPMPAPTHEFIGPDDKISHKTTFQIRHGLPVRANVPVVLFSGGVAEETPEVLRSFLRSDVQAIALKGDNALAKLAEKYPDRLALIDDEKEHFALASADGCVVGNDPSLANMALIRGTIPIGGPGISGKVVDLEPSCKSGSGILLEDLSSSSLLSGLERFAAACTHVADFRALSTRVPKYVPTWPDIANYYLQLMTSQGSNLT